MKVTASIPKTIHYCWFGDNQLGPDELRCIESWKKYLPDFEIKRWDESNWDVRCCDYVSEAYDAKKWAFVSDYARFDILYREGGLYFDTDVELISSIDDILEQGPFMGFETDFGTSSGTVAPGLGLAANPGLGLYKAILDSYEGNHFLGEDGLIDKTTIVTRTTEVLSEYGLKPQTGIQKIGEITIYPSDYFNPKDMWSGEINITENTRSIHHFSMSWYSDADKLQHDVESSLQKYFPKGKFAHRVAVLVAMMRYGDLSVAKTFLKRHLTRAQVKAAKAE